MEYQELLEEFIEKYSRHDNDCLLFIEEADWEQEASVCTCGYSDAVKRLLEI